MAILQRVATYPNERLDTPDFRALEAFAQNDWIFFMKGVLANKSYVLSGFEISNYQNIFLTGGIRIRQNNVVILHPEAKTQAAGFYVAAGSEADANLLLSPSSTNFIEADMATTSGTPDTRAFWDMGANGGKGAEFTAQVDTVINLELSVTSNISGFTDGRIPLYKIVTDAQGVATEVTDCRNLFFRLGTGGSSPNPDADYTYPELPDAGHAELETPIKANSATSTNAPFQGGDKNIKTFKQWMDLVMTLLMKNSAVPYWYVPGLSNPETYQNSSMIVTVGGTWQHLSGTPGRLTLLSGSTIYRLGKDNNLSIAPFSSLDMTVNKALFILMPKDDAVNYTMGDNGSTPIVPKKVTAVTNTSITVFTGGNYLQGGGKLFIRNQEFSYDSYDSITGTFLQVSPDPTGLVKVNDYTYQAHNGTVGHYHYGPGSTVPSVRNGVSDGVERAMWLAFFDGAKMHTTNADLEVGEQIQVGDNTSQAILNYIGSTGEADSTPVYNVATIPNGTNLTSAITTLYNIIETPIYDEILVDTGGTGWPNGTIIPLPPNSRAGNSPASYTQGTAELCVYDNGVLMRPGYDYTEINSSNIQLLRDVFAGSYLRFRVANVGGAGAAAGGGAGGDLQDAYANGAQILIAPSTPIDITGPADEPLLKVQGDVQFDGDIKNPTSIAFQTTNANPIDLGKSGFWVDSTDGNRIKYTKTDGTIVKLGETAELFASDAQYLSRTFINNTGSTIPAYAAVYINTNGHIALASASSAAGYKFLGITKAAIPNGSSGKVIYAGVVAGIFTSLGLTPGFMWLSVTAGTLSTIPPSNPGEYLVIAGLIDGDDLILQPQFNGQVGV